MLTESEIDQTQRDLAGARRTLITIRDGLDPRGKDFADTLGDLSRVYECAADAIEALDATAKRRGNA